MARAVAAVVGALFFATACTPTGEAPGPVALEVAPHVGEVVGVVRDAEGGLIGGAHITTSPRGHEATADGAGAYRLPWLPPGSYELVVAAAGHNEASFGPIDVVAGETAAVDLTLTTSPGPGQVMAFVTDPTGAPLVGAIVRAPPGEDAITDAAGVAVIGGLSGSVVDVEASDPDGLLWPATATDIQIPAAGAAQVALQLAGRAPASAEPIGSAACAECHEDAGSAHATDRHAAAMGPSTPEIDAIFTAGTWIDLGGGASATATTTTGPAVQLQDALGEVRTYEVAGWIGDPTHGAVAWAEVSGTAMPLPLAWRADDPDRPGYPGTAAAALPHGATRWLDEAGAFLFPADAPPPESSADALCFACHATGFTLTTDGAGAAEMVGTDGGRWLEPGVGCERCHGPGSAHEAAALANDRPAWSITDPADLSPEAARDVCGQCHRQVEGINSGLPHPHAEDDGPYLPGAALQAAALLTPVEWPSGAAAAPHSQADELQLSVHGEGTAYAMRCEDCHAPHGGVEASLVSSAHDNTLCTSCHLGWTWSGDATAMNAHGQHDDLDPAGESEKGRCTTCHMPGTAADVSFDHLSGAGDLASHLFAPRPPQDAIDYFDIAGTTTLPLGSFPMHGCTDCHAYNDWRLEQEGSIFIGPTGSPGRRDIHQALQTAWGTWWP